MPSCPAGHSRKDGDGGAAGSTHDALAAAIATCERLREHLMALDLGDIDPALYRAKANGRNRVES